MIEIAPVEILGIEIVISFIEACIQKESTGNSKHKTPEQYRDRPLMNFHIRFLIKTAE
jgi:hypothetical protein